MRAQNIFFHASEAQGESPVTNDSRVEENGKQHFVSWKPLEERESFLLFFLGQLILETLASSVWRGSWEREGEVGECSGPLCVEISGTVGLHLWPFGE